MLSIVLAVHNEEKNLGRCLEAVKNIADEIVVVDGESTDATVAIARKYRARVIRTTNKLNFHINKQMAMDAAKGEVVLQLDADEVVDDELRTSITHIHQQALRSTPSTTQPVAWWLKRKNYFLGRFLTKGGQYPDPVIRLYIRGYARLPHQDVHEQMTVDGPVGWAEGHLLHYGNPTFADYVRKFNTYTSFRAEQWFEAGVRLTWMHTLRYFFWQPLVTFGLLYFRHKGLVDGVPGFVFAAMSGVHYQIAYLKLWEKYVVAGK